MDTKILCDTRDIISGTSPATIDFVPGLCAPSEEGCNLHISNQLVGSYLILHLLPTLITDIILT